MDEAMTPSKAGETEMIRLVIFNHPTLRKRYYLDGKRVSEHTGVQWMGRLNDDEIDYRWTGK